MAEETVDTTAGAGDGGVVEGGGGEGGAGGSGAGSTPDVSALLERLDGFGSRFDGLEDRLAGIEGPEDEEDPGREPESLLPQFGPDDFDAEGNLSLEAQTREINSLIEQRVNEALAPIEQQRVQERRDAYTDALEERYPDLAENADDYIQRTIDFCAQIGRPELAAEPEMLETVYLRAMAEQRAAGEIPAGSEREVTLERGGGAGPAPADAAGEAGDRIVNALKGQSFRLGR